MNREQLNNFLIGHSKNSFTKDAEKKWLKEPDGSTTILYQSGDFSLRDNFAGGNQYGGIEIVSYQGKRKWIMGYHGGIEESVNANPNAIITFLHHALTLAEPDFPIRGPRHLFENGWLYILETHGTVESFHASESIHSGNKEKGVLVYQAHFTGGIISL